MRRFEFNQGTSSKFWEIDVRGPMMEVCFGRLGTQGQIQARLFGNAKAAEQEAQALIREKTQKGYVETAPSPAIRATLRNRWGDEHTVILRGRRVTINEGGDLRSHDCETEAAAKANFEHIVALRKKSGFFVVHSGSGAAGQPSP